MEYKIQHYVPVVYLRNWSVNQNVRNRNSEIWRFLIDGETWQKVKAKREGCEDFHYSRLAAEVAEKSFHEMENDYATLTSEAIGGNLALNRRGTLQWMLIATDLFVRNSIHLNETEEENFKAYRRRSIMFLSFLSGLPADAEMQIIGDTLLSNWQVLFLTYKPTPDEHLITSDVPCIPLSLMGLEQICFYMPVGPSLAIIIAPKTVKARTTVLTERDLIYLNHAVVINAKNVLYSYTKPSLNNFHIIVADWRENVSGLESVWDGNRWKISRPTYIVKLDFYEFK